MTSAFNQSTGGLPLVSVDVVEHGKRARKGTLRCEIGKNLRFSTTSIESYFYAKWDPVLYDALLIAAAVEFCDRVQKRLALIWGREFHLRIPVHDLELWNTKAVSGSLHEALNFITGDRWNISFYRRKSDAVPVRQSSLALKSDFSAVIPFSDGMDSLAVAELMALELGEQLALVRLGPKKCKWKKHSPKRPFSSVPFHVRKGMNRFRESSARSRGFKFTLISGIAAYLSNASQVIISESGQGALGPAFIPVGQAYADYRNHPMFTVKMEKFFSALLGYQVRYKFPQLWVTKGQTLAKYVTECKSNSDLWVKTKSCWQQNRHVSVSGKTRQCGICAACMLRRLAVHAAGLTEPKTTYVWEDLGAVSLEKGAAKAFDRKKITGAMSEYAIAGVLHLDHLAGLQNSPTNTKMLDLSAFQLGQSLELPHTQVRKNIDHLLAQHKAEWENFMKSLGPTSFVAEWATKPQR